MIKQSVSYIAMILLCQGCFLSENHRAAKNFVNTEVRQNYGDQFDISWSSLNMHAGGPTSSSTFGIKDKSDPPITFRYIQIHGDSMHFNSIKFLSSYETVTAYRNGSLMLDKNAKSFYPYSISESNRIGNGNKYRWVNSIDTGRPLSIQNSKEEFESSDSLSLEWASKVESNDQIFNFYFLHKPSSFKSDILKRPHHFEGLKLETSSNWHYRVDVIKDSSTYKITNRMLFINLEESTITELGLKISDYLKEQGISYKPESLRIEEYSESNPKRNLNVKSFMFQGDLGQDYIGKINLVNFQISVKKKSI